MLDVERKETMRLLQYVCASHRSNCSFGGFNVDLLYMFISLTLTLPPEDLFRYLPRYMYIHKYTSACAYAVNLHNTFIYGRSAAGYGPHSPGQISRMPSLGCIGCHCHCHPDVRKSSAFFIFFLLFGAIFNIIKKPFD